MRANKNTRLQSKGGYTLRPHKAYNQYIDTGLGVFTKSEIFRIFLGAAALVLGVLTIAVVMGLTH